MAETPSKRSRLWIGLCIALILGGGLVYYLLPSTRDRITVRTARAEQGDLKKEVATNGRVEPLVDFQAHAGTPSTVQQLPVRLGEAVARGQALVKLDAADAQLRVATAHNAVQIADQGLHNLASGGTQDELLSARADLRRAEVEAAQAASSLDSLKALQARGAASASEVAAAQQRLTDTRLRQDQLQTRLRSRYGAGDLASGRSQAQQARVELAAAEDNLAGLNIHSPIAGTVYSLPVARYDYVQAGELLISVADLHRLQVRAFFDEPVIGSLAAGQPVRIVWDAKPDRVWHGHVTQAPTTVTNIGSRNVGECLISVDDANGDLLPNTNVTVTVTTLQRFGVLSLPREALHTEGMTNFVYRIQSGKLVRTPISVGVVNLTRVEVTGGLAPGDVVALGATTDVDLRNGLPVRAQP